MTITDIPVAPRHQGLRDNEIVALTSLGVPLNDPTITVEVTWDDSWRSIGTGDWTNIPYQWTASVPHLIYDDEPDFSRQALEHGPRDLTSTVHVEEDQGILDDLGHWFSRIPAEYGTIDPNSGLTLNVSGWALLNGGFLA